jgi:hypothetical protein
MMKIWFIIEHDKKIIYVINTYDWNITNIVIKMDAAAWVKEIIFALRMLIFIWFLIVHKLLIEILNQNVLTIMKPLRHE